MNLATPDLRAEHPSGGKTLVFAGFRSAFSSKGRVRFSGIRSNLLLYFASLLIVPIFSSSALASATNFYITASGSASGNCPSGTTSAPNVALGSMSSSNWGSGTGQIGPGTTVLLCGTLTATAGGSGITILNSGAAGNPIVIQFDTGAILQTAYFGGYSSAGGIYVNGYSYITIDGKNTGIIQNTANGTNLANQRYSDGICLNNTANITIQNLTIQNIYQNAGSQPSATDTAGAATMDIELGGTLSSLVVNNNILSGARMGVNTNFNGNANGITISNNTFTDHGWMVSVTSSDAGTLAGVGIFGNSFTNWDNWQFPTSAYHSDGIFLYMRGGNTNPFRPLIYNNYFGGNLGDGNSTGYVYLSSDGSGGAVDFQGTVFNNTFISDNHTTYAGGPTPGFTGIVMNPTTGPHYIYNNTFVAPLQAGQAIFQQGGSGKYAQMTLLNNIFVGYCAALLDNGSAATDVIASNNNVFYNQCLGGNQVIVDSGGQMSLATWQGKKFDLASVTANPNLTSAGVPQAGSSSIGLGTNLTSLGITALGFSAPTTFGAGGGSGSVPRPSPLGAWNSGASSPPLLPPSPPSNVVAVSR